jgi:hypothetical protein
MRIRVFAPHRFQRVPIPGQVQVSLAKPGGYTLYFEGLGAADEQATILPFKVSLTSVGSGQEIPIRPYGGAATYNFAGHAGRAVGTFRIEEPGQFLLQATGASQRVQADLAVGRSIGPAIVPRWSRPYPEPSSCSSGRPGWRPSWQSAGTGPGSRQQPWTSDSLFTP